MPGLLQLSEQPVDLNLIDHMICSSRISGTQSMCRVRFENKSGRYTGIVDDYGFCPARHRASTLNVGLHQRSRRMQAADEVT